MVEAFQNVVMRLAMCGLGVSLATMALRSRPVRVAFARMLAIWRGLTAFGRFAVCSFLLVGILVGGDTKVGCREMDYLVMNRDIDVAILDFPWTTLKSGRDAICEFVQPKNLVVVHLPFEDDDYSGFRPATKKGVADIKDSIGYSLDVRIMSEPLQQEKIIL